MERFLSDLHKELKNFKFESRKDKDLSFRERFGSSSDLARTRGSSASILSTTATSTTNVDTEQEPSSESNVSVSTPTDVTGMPSFGEASDVEEDDDEKEVDVGEVELSAPVVTKGVRFGIVDAPVVSTQEIAMSPIDEEEVPLTRVKERKNFPNGDSYDGETLNGVIDGRGVYTYACGDIFDGEFHKGMKHGEGTAIYTSGGMHNGLWHNDKPVADKKCTLAYTTGDKYVGFAVGGAAPSGGGIIRMVREGYGEMGLANGDRYYGHFKQNKRQGFGIMVYRSGAKFYGLWEDNKKHGYGVAVESDGAFYVGEFRKDMKHGDGEMHFPSGSIVRGAWREDKEVKRAEILQVPFSNCPRSSFVMLQLSVEEQLRKEKAEDQSFILMPASKWHGLFNLYHEEMELLKKSRPAGLYPIYEEMKKKEQEEKDKQKPARRQRVHSLFQRLVPTHKSIVGDAVENFRMVEEYLEWLFCSSEEPIGKIVYCFVNSFEGRYDSTSKMARSQLPNALDDLHSFISDLHESVLAVSGDHLLALCEPQELLYCIKTSIVKKVFKSLFKMYKEMYREKDAHVAFKLRSLNRCTLSDIGVSAEMQPQAGDHDYDEPFKNAIRSLRHLSNTRSHAEKFDALLETSVEVENHIKLICEMADDVTAVKGAEELFPIFLYVFIKANVPHIYCEFKFLQDFHDETIQVGERAFRFSNFEAAISYVQQLDWNVRDNRGALVPVEVIEGKLEEALQSCLSKCQIRRESLPSLTWLCDVMSMLGNINLQKVHIKIQPPRIPIKGRKRDAAGALPSPASATAPQSPTPPPASDETPLQESQTSLPRPAIRKSTVQHIPSPRASDVQVEEIVESPSHVTLSNAGAYYGSSQHALPAVSSDGLITCDFLVLDQEFTPLARENFASACEVLASVGVRLEKRAFISRRDSDVKPASSESSSDEDSQTEGKHDSDHESEDSDSDSGEDDPKYQSWKNSLLKRAPEQARKERYIMLFEQLFPSYVYENLARVIERTLTM